jgi:hemerythrin superfamily protein
MDAISILEDDHKKVKSLFREYEKAGEGDGRKKQQLRESITKELEVHTTIEQDIFYPAVRETQSDEVAEAIEEHRVVQELLKELASIRPSDERFDAKMSVLMENVEHHADEEEEKEMFPRAKKDLGNDRLRELGARMEQRRSELRSAA